LSDSFTAVRFARAALLGGAGGEIMDFDGRPYGVLEDAWRHVADRMREIDDHIEQLVISRTPPARRVRC
jgi:hypothetical protein